MTVVIAAVMYATGESAALLVRRFATRLGGERGAGVVDLAGGAIRGVALGVGGTAVAQALVGGLGLAIAGVPFSGLLTAAWWPSGWSASSSARSCWRWATRCWKRG